MSQRGKQTDGQTLLASVLAGWASVLVGWALGLAGRALGLAGWASGLASYASGLEGEANEWTDCLCPSPGWLCLAGLASDLAGWAGLCPLSRPLPKNEMTV